MNKTEKTTDEQVKEDGVIALQTSNAAINATIKAVRATGKKFELLVQTGIEQCIQHAKDYGDCTGAARLVDAMPKSVRRAEVVAHFGEYSPIRIVPDAKTKLMKASLRKPEDELFRPWNVEGVKQNPWFARKSITDAREPGMPYDISSAGADVISLADKIMGKATAANAKETAWDAKTGETIERENVKVKDEDRKALVNFSKALRKLAFDHRDAMALLGMENEEDIENLEDATEEENLQPQVATGTNG